MKKKDLHEVYCLGSIPVDAGRLCFYDLLEKKIKKTFNERKLTKEIKENKKINTINTNSFDISLFADGAYPCYAVVDQYKRIKKIFFELTNSCGWGSSLFEQDKTRIDRLKSETISKKKVPFDYQMDMPIPARIAIDFNRNHRFSYTPWSHYNFIYNDEKFLKKKKNKKIKLCNLKISSNALIIEDSPSISRSDLSLIKVHVSPDTLNWTFPVEERTIIPLENKTYPVYLYYSEKSEKVIIKDFEKNEYMQSNPMFPILSIENLNSIRLEKEIDSRISIHKQRKQYSSDYFLKKVNYFEPNRKTNAEKNITICQLDLDNFKSLDILEKIKPKLDTLELRHLYHIEDWSPLFRAYDVKTLKFTNCKFDANDKKPNSWFDVVSRFYFNRNKKDESKPKELRKLGNLEVIVNGQNIFKKLDKRLKK